MSKEIYSSVVHHMTAVRTTVAFESTQTEVSELSIRVHMRMPQVGEYLLSKCRKMAYRVLRHQKAKACGQPLTVIFVGEPTPVTEENQFGDKGVVINVHLGKCTSHCIDEYYLARPVGYRINATLL